MAVAVSETTPRFTALLEGAVSVTAGPEFTAKVTSSWSSRAPVLHAEPMPPPTRNWARTAWYLPEGSTYSVESTWAPVAPGSSVVRYVHEGLLASLAKNRSNASVAVSRAWTWTSIRTRSPCVKSAPSTLDSLMRLIFCASREAVPSAQAELIVPGPP